RYPPVVPRISSKREVIISLLVSPPGTQPFSTEKIDDSIYIKTINNNLLPILQEVVKCEDLYSVNPKVSAHELFMILPELKKYISKDPEVTNNKMSRAGNESYDPLVQLVDWLEKEFEATLQQIKNMIDKNEISFNNLWYIFPVATQVYAEIHEKISGARVTNCEYQTCFGIQYFVVNCENIDSNGHGFINSFKSWTIPYFIGVSDIENLPVVPLPKECAIRDELVKRGRKFETLAIGSHYMRYEGKFFKTSWFGPTYFKGDGRMMIDATTFSQINPNYNMGMANNNRRFYRIGGRNMHGQNDTSSQNKVKEDELYMCSPTFFGFSFFAKKWGQFYVDQVYEIEFDDDAFNELIMDANKKKIIKSLVNSEIIGLDLISGKGGGCIFLLHGPPGVGKTLTAEAISEYLHRPLYAVSVGELGVTPKELEDQLGRILEVASAWDAVILIDEVDIFLEQRSKNDINRNALVGIFLRLLEYHQGILFLTTNRVECFDKAFHSRLSIVLKYEELDELARAQVWRTFLDRADGKDKSQVDIEKLKKRQMNGREIKTAVRMAK
ncbi:314_t:CDS:10, partial [Scutellospora calospora]